RQTMKETTTPVGFRLNEPDRKRLTEAAAQLGLSPGAYARRLVLESLDDENHRQILTELTELRDAVARLHQALAAATATMLVWAGKASAEEAEEFVRSNLRQESPS